MKKAGVLLMVLLISAVAWAQNLERPGKASRQKSKAYIEANILPVAIENRNDFEAVLSASEKEKIQELRARQAIMKEKKKTFQEQYKGKKDGAKNEPTDEQLAAMRKTRKEQRLITTEAFEIIDEHEDFFLAMESDLKDDKAKWRSDMKAIMEAGRVEKDKSGRPAVGENGERGPRRKGQHGKGHGGMRRGGGIEKMFTPVAFLLLDPENTKFAEGQEDINIYPNPAANRQTIAIDLKDASIVKVELIDAEGKALKTLFNGNLNKGVNNIEVDISNLKGQQYFYKITTPSGSETKRVLLKN